MKYINIIVIFFLLGFCVQLNAQATAIDKYFKQYVEDDRFTVVYISPKLFQMIGKLNVKGVNWEDDETEALLDIAQDLRGLRILVSDEDSRALYEEAKAKINTSEYEILMTVRDKDGDNVEFLVKDSENTLIDELLLLVGGRNDFVLISLVGEISLDKVSKLAREIEDENYDYDDDEEREEEKKKKGNNNEN